MDLTTDERTDAMHTRGGRRPSHRGPVGAWIPLVMLVAGATVLAACGDEDLQDLDPGGAAGDALIEEFGEPVDTEFRTLSGATLTVTAPPGVVSAERPGNQLTVADEQVTLQVFGPLHTRLEDDVIEDEQPPERRWDGELQLVTTAAGIEVATWERDEVAAQIVGFDTATDTPMAEGLADHLDRFELSIDEGVPQVELVDDRLRIVEERNSIQVPNLEGDLTIHPAIPEDVEALARSRDDAEIEPVEVTGGQRYDDPAGRVSLLTDELIASVAVDPSDEEQARYAIELMSVLEVEVAVPAP